MRRFAATVIFIALFPCGMSAARLILRDGTAVVGSFVAGSPDHIVFRDDAGMERRFDINQVQSIDFAYVDPGADRYRDGGYDQQIPPEGERFALLDPGTPISVRTNQSIDSRNAWQGMVYPATIVQDVNDRDGRVVIPRGSPANMVIRRVEQGPLGEGNLVLDLDAVQVNGHWYHVASTAMVGRRSPIGANKRTAEMVGGGAAIGTLLGAIAGGGKGAAVGAAAGAVAGGGVEVLTKGREIHVPAESVLNFGLDRPLELRAVR